MVICQWWPGRNSERLPIHVTGRHTCCFGWRQGYSQNICILSKLPVTTDTLHFQHRHQHVQSTITGIFLTWARQNFSNEIYGLGIGTHANGWIPPTNTNYYSASQFSLGIDTGIGGNMYNDRDSTGHTGAQMDISEFAQAIIRSGVHPHYIFLMPAWCKTSKQRMNCATPPTIS